MCSERSGWSPESRCGSSAPGVINRRNFLRLGGAGLAGVVLLGSAGVGTVLARGQHSPREASLVAEFRAAAEEYGVPMELLMAMGYVNTRWEMPPPWANSYVAGDLHGWGSYGIMALVQNPYSDTLGEASRLTGIPEERLKTDRAANIRGGAALLASSAGWYRPAELSGFFGAVAGRGLADGINYAAVSGIGGGELYAEQVFEALQTGASATTFSGENVFLPAQGPASVLGGERWPANPR
jgi:hypothetical protein